MIKKCICLFFICICITSCSDEQLIEHKVFRVGMLISMGGIGDRAFNDSAVAGLNKAAETFDIVTRLVDYRSPEKNLENLRIFAEEKYDLIIGIGFFNLSAIELAAREFPDSRFAIIDAASKNPAIYSAVYHEQEASFLAGVLAAIRTNNKKVAFIGGADIPVVDIIRKSYFAGVKYIAEDIITESVIAGTFNDPELGYQIANELFDEGYDVLYSGAGKTGVGAISSAMEHDSYFIGTDTDQSGIAPDNVLGSRIKNIDVVILEMVSQLLEDEFSLGLHVFGLAENGLSLKLNYDILFDSEVETIKKVEAGIIEGTVDITAFIADENIAGDSNVK